MPTLVATPGDPAANSYETAAEADAYFDSRLPLVPPWVPAAPANDVALIMGTRTLDSLAVPHRRLVRDSKGDYYITTPQWTGVPTTSTQALAWPRTGMYDRLGRPIDPMVIPQELKDALSELAGQLQAGDRTLDNDIIVQGIKSVSAGSVSVSFKDDIKIQVLPDAVMLLMPASWFTDELIEPAQSFAFEVL